MKDILLFKGTLDPIHNAHKYNVDQAQEESRSGRIIVVPKTKCPHKVNVTQIDHRVAMASLAFDGRKDVQVQKFGGSISTRRILEGIKKENCDAQISLLMGADAYLFIKNDIGIFKELCSFTISPRESVISYDALCEDVERTAWKTGMKINIIKPSGLLVSSGYVRENIRDASLMKNALPPKVYDYILENDLYGVNGGEYKMQCRPKTPAIRK